MMPLKANECDMTDIWPSANAKKGERKGGKKNE